MHNPAPHASIVQVPNKLAGETSPYLLQHAANPVDWHPWGPEALELALREDKPILLSIGYAACHWCHVMAHESFEDEATARVMNDHFVNVKVDREERPDIDSIYMQAVQAMSGHGGWPMTIFLTPDGAPFYGGTYFPPEDRHGLPSFRRILESVSEAYRDRREGITQTAAQIAELLRSGAAGSGDASGGAPNSQTLDLAYRTLARNYDVVNAGFGTAPKFPASMTLDFLLRYWWRTGTEYALEMVRETFLRMIRGGIYDQVGGGMARYSVDEKWLVPHFEKMLYDNALLIRLGANLWQATRNDEVGTAVSRAVEWVRREMTSPEGGFYSSLDADSEGHEGLFYLWSQEEIDALLGKEAALAKAYYGVTPAGNFEGRNILFIAAPPAVTASRAGIEVSELPSRIENARQILYDARAKRVWPGLDDKILAGWNGLMLRGIATAARVFGRADWRELALRNGEFLESKMVRGGRVMRSYKGGAARIPGFLEDHASVGLAFISLYELTFDEGWLSPARKIAEAMISAFWSDSEKRIYDTAADAERLIIRPRDITDNAIPSGSSLAAELFLHLGNLYDEARYREIAASILAGAGEMLSKYATAFGHLLGAIDFSVNGANEVALVGDPASDGFRALERTVAEEYVPSLVLAAVPDGAKSELALLTGRTAIDGKPTAYFCRGYVCDEPVTNQNDLSTMLRKR